MLKIHQNIEGATSVNSSSGHNYPIQKLHYSDSGVYKLQCLHCHKFSIRFTKKSFIEAVYDWTKSFGRNLTNIEASHYINKHPNISKENPFDCYKVIMVILVNC